MHLDEVPVDVDVALTERGELRERGAREVEAVGGAARAKVGHGDGDGLAGVCEQGLARGPCLNVQRHRLWRQEIEYLRVATSCLPQLAPARYWSAESATIMSVFWRGLPQAP